MQVKGSSLIISLAVIFLTAVCVCLTAAVLGFGGFNIYSGIERSNATPTSTPFPISSLPALDNNELLSEDTARRMDEIQVQVIQIRGLLPSQSLARELLTGDELRNNVMSEFLADYYIEDAEVDALILNTLGLLEPDFDLIGFYTDLYSEQIAGYYDDTLKSMFVVKGSGFGGQESSTYAHEYVHALQDQNYDLSNGLKFNDDDCAIDTERCLGVQSLIEGDATVTEQLWLSRFASKTDRADILRFYSQFESPVFDSAPAYMQQDFLFPYLYGSEFVYTLLDKGGWEAVDAAYLDPPISAEQIMHPDRYPDDKPVSVSIGDFSELIGDDWKEIDRGVMGEWYTFLIFAWNYQLENRLPDDIARKAVEGWGGDQYVVYWNLEDSSTMFSQEITFDSIEDTNEFWDALLEYGELRWETPVSSIPDEVSWQGPSGKALAIKNGKSVYWGFGSDWNILNLVIQEISR